jgi:hypothetical protein
MKYQTIGTKAEKIAASTCYVKTCTKPEATITMLSRPTSARLAYQDTQLGNPYNELRVSKTLMKHITISLKPFQSRGLNHNVIEILFV